MSGISNHSDIPEKDYLQSDENESLLPFSGKDVPSDDEDEEVVVVGDTDDCGSILSASKTKAQGLGEVAEEFDPRSTLSKAAQKDTKQDEDKGVKLIVLAVCLFLFFDVGKLYMEPIGIKGLAVHSNFLVVLYALINVFLAPLVSLCFGVDKFKSIFQWSTLKNFAFPALFFGMQTVFGVVVPNYIPGSLKKVLGQIRIPLTALAGKFILGKGYTAAQWVAILAIFAGTFGFTYLTGSMGEDSSNFVLGLIFVILTNVCGVIGSLLSEKFLKRNKGTPFYVQKSQIEMWQLLVALTMWLVVMPYVMPEVLKIALDPYQVEVFREKNQFAPYRVVLETKGNTSYHAGVTHQKLQMDGTKVEGLATSIKEKNTLLNGLEIADSPDPDTIKAAKKELQNFKEEFTFEIENLNKAVSKQKKYIQKSQTGTKELFLGEEDFGQIFSLVKFVTDADIKSAKNEKNLTEVEIEQGTKSKEQLQEEEKNILDLEAALKVQKPYEGGEVKFGKYSACKDFNFQKVEELGSTQAKEANEFLVQEGENKIAYVDVSGLDKDLLEKLEQEQPNSIKEEKYMIKEKAKEFLSDQSMGRVFPALEKALFHSCDKDQPFFKVTLIEATSKPGEAESARVEMAEYNGSNTASKTITCLKSIDETDYQKSKVAKCTDGGENEYLLFPGITAVGEENDGALVTKIASRFGFGYNRFPWIMPLITLLSIVMSIGQGWTSGWVTKILSSLMKNMLGAVAMGVLVYIEMIGPNFFTDILEIKKLIATAIVFLAAVGFVLAPKK